MVADTHFSQTPKATPDEIVSRHLAMADHDIQYQNGQIEGLQSQIAEKNKALSKAFGIASMSLAGAALAAAVTYNSWTVPVEQRVFAVEAAELSAHQTCVEKVAEGHIANTEQEMGVCEKIFYADEMECAATKYRLRGALAAVFSLGLLGVAFSKARDGHKALGEKRGLEQGVEQATQKIICAAASRQTADAILVELNA